MVGRLLVGTTVGSGEGRNVDVGMSVVGTTVGRIVVGNTEGIK
eukprot:gene39916-49338_t